MAVVLLVLMVASITFPRRSTQTSTTTLPSSSLRTVMEGLEITFRYIRPVNGALPVPVLPVPVALFPSLPVPVPRPLPLPFPSLLPFMSLVAVFSELPETNRGASGAVLVIRGLLTTGAGAGVGLGFAASGSGTWGLGLGAGANGAGFISGFSGRLANRSGLASILLIGCLTSCGIAFGFL